MTRTGPAVERFTAPASNAGRSTGSEGARASGGRDAGNEPSFRKLLSKMAETDGGRAPASSAPSPARAEARIAETYAHGIGPGGDQPAEAGDAPAGEDSGATVDSAGAAGADLSPASLLSAILAGTATGRAASTGPEAQAVAKAHAAPTPGDDSADAMPVGSVPKLTILRQETFLAPGAQATIVGKAGVAGMEAGRLAGGQDPAGSDESADPLAPTSTPTGPRRGDVDALSAQADGADAGDASLAGGDGSGDALADPEPAAVATRKDGGAAIHQPLSPIEQLADRITREAQAAAGTARTGQINPAGASPPTAVKVLHIELQPNDLGTVTVRMALKGDALELHVDVDTQETADLLRKDWEKLTSQLRAAGYQVDGVIVRVTNAEPTAAAPPTAQGFADSPTSSQSGSAQADARASGGQGQREGHASSSPTSRSSHNEESRDPNRRSGGLYV